MDFRDDHPGNRETGYSNVLGSTGVDSSGARSTGAGITSAGITSAGSTGAGSTVVGRCRSFGSHGHMRVNTNNSRFRAGL